jgi:hypothetical protein
MEEYKILFDLVLGSFQVYRYLNPWSLTFNPPNPNPIQVNPGLGSFCICLYMFHMVL